MSEFIDEFLGSRTVKDQSYSVTNILEELNNSKKDFTGNPIMEECHICGGETEFICKTCYESVCENCLSTEDKCIICHDSNSE